MLRKLYDLFVVVLAILFIFSIIEKYEAVKLNKLLKKQIDEQQQFIRKLSNTNNTQQEIIDKLNNDKNVCFAVLGAADVRLKQLNLFVTNRLNKYGEKAANK